MNKKERAKVVRAMDTIIKALNDERHYCHWIMVGVADGDLDDDTEVDDYYLDSENLSELMYTFLHIMSHAGTEDATMVVDKVRSKKPDWM